MQNDEFLIYIESVHDPSDVVAMLLRYGICDEMDVYRKLGEYVLELKEYLDMDEI